ncbi:MAG: hypothetical protein ACNFW9_03485 [Candidatus Kerfeldbacteria bacterium]
MDINCVQTVILRKMIGILRADSNNNSVSGYTLFSELSLSDFISELMRIDLNIMLDIPEIPHNIIYRIPVCWDMQDEFPPFNELADFGHSVRDMSISITLWLLQNHPKIHTNIASL